MSCQPFAFFCRSAVRSCRPGPQEKQFRHVPDAGADLNCKPFSAPLLPCLPVGPPAGTSPHGKIPQNGGLRHPCANSCRQAVVADSAGGSGASLVSGGRRPARASQTSPAPSASSPPRASSAARMAPLDAGRLQEACRCMADLPETAGAASRAEMRAGGEKARGWQKAHEGRHREGRLRSRFWQALRRCSLRPAWRP